MGAEIAMVPMGEALGAFVSKSGKVVLVIAVCLVLGFFITIAEPDLQVLAQQVPTVPNTALIFTVALGAGFFLVIAFLRMIFQIPLSYMLIGFYGICFILVFFAPEYMAVAFDAGGVTTGPITVPFFMAFGIGLAAVRGGKNSQEDSFGLVALCSIGPVLAVLLLGMFYGSGTDSYVPAAVDEISGIGAVLLLLLRGIPVYIKEMASALLPILIVFILFQVLVLKRPRRQFLRIIIGLLYALAGLVFFLVAVNVGYIPIGDALGHQLAALPYHWILIPFGIVLGFAVVAAEPAVHVLKKQVEEVSAGAISQRAMLISLCIGVSAAVGLAMVRVMYGIPLWYFLLPGYVLSLLLTFFVPPLFTAVAFDSGGVAAGSMTATFILAFVIGVSDALGGNVLSDAFGIIAMVAMTPLVTLQVLGLIAEIRLRRLQKELPPQGEEGEDEEIIDF